jgi:hypothetical protein
LIVSRNGKLRSLRAGSWKNEKNERSDGFLLDKAFRRAQYLKKNA